MGVNIRINGVPIKEPLDVGFENYNLTKSGRVAAGDMTMQLVAKKRKLNVAYEVLSAKEMENIFALIDTDEMFFTVTYIENGIEKTMTAYAGAIKRDKFRAEELGGWYWKNVNFALIEQ